MSSNKQLDDALALVGFGPCRGADRPQDWIKVAVQMTAHCKGEEDVNLAAARIIAAEYRNMLAILKNPTAVHLNMLRGEIAWTPETLRHLLGDTSTESEKSALLEAMRKIDELTADDNGDPWATLEAIGAIAHNAIHHS